MPLKYRYFVFVGLLHLVLAVLTYQLLALHRVWFLVVEGVLLVSLYFAYRLYRSLIRPLEYLATGIDALQDQDFSVKFTPQGIREIDRLINVYNGMIDNIRAERVQLQEQHYFLHKLIQASPAGIILLNFSEEITDLNPRARDLLGQPDWVLPLSIQQTDHPLLKIIRQLPAGSSEVVRLAGAQRYRCEVATFIDRGFHRKFILLQEFSRELLTAEKEAYGKVIRMMAHEVNNSIGAINSILHSLTDPASSDTELATDAREVLPVAIERNERLNHFMSNFAQVVRLPDPRIEQVDLNALLLRARQLLLVQAQQQHIDISTHLATGPLWVPADVQQLEQVLINLIKNSFESIGEGGTIQLFTYTQPLGFVIADNGPGIPPHLANQLFSPFFTTKPTGQGVGLTLVREILQQHHTHFSLQTDPDGWTRFRVNWVS